MCVSCARAMQNELDRLVATEPGTVPLDNDAQIVLNVMQGNDDSYQQVFRLLAVYYAMFPVAFGMMITAVGQLMTGGVTALPIDKLLQGYVPKATH